MFQRGGGEFDGPTRLTTAQRDALLVIESRLLNLSQVFVSDESEMATVHPDVAARARTQERHQETRQILLEWSQTLLRLLRKPVHQVNWSSDANCITTIDAVRMDLDDAIDVCNCMSRMSDRPWDYDIHEHLNWLVRCVPRRASC